MNLFLNKYLNLSIISSINLTLSSIFIPFLIAVIECLLKSIIIFFAFLITTYFFKGKTFS